MNDVKTTITTGATITVFLAISLVGLAESLDNDLKEDKSKMATSRPIYSFKYIPHNCWNFTVGHWNRRELYTPHYPHNYTINTECVNMIKAPKGHVVELDFRDRFHLEGGKCKYDFFEVRDGPFGYSPLIGRYCGHRFPPLILSTQEFMWLRFKSDGVLNYGGFRAVYKFRSRRTYDPDRSAERKQSRPACQVMFSSDATDRKLSSEVDLPYNHLEASKEGDLEVDCTWHITTKSNRKILFRPTSLKVIDEANCGDNFVDVYDGTTLPKDLVKRFCVGLEATIKSHTNRLFVRIYGKSIYHKPTFEAVVTPFWLGNKRDTCRAQAHSCGNFVCVSGSNRCNKRQNCDNYSDEKGCEPDVEDTTETNVIPRYTVIVGAVGGFLLIVVLIIVCVVCRHKKRKAKIERGEHNGEISRRQSCGEARKCSARRLSAGVISNRSTTPNAGSPVPVTKADIHPSRPDSGFTETHRTVDLDFPEELSDAGKFKRFKSMDYYPDSQLISVKPPAKPYMYYPDGSLKYETFYQQSTLDRPQINISYPIAPVHDQSHFLAIPTAQRVLEKNKLNASPTNQSPSKYPDTPYNYPL